MFYKIQYGLVAVQMPSYFERPKRITRHSQYIYIFIAIALDESIFLDVLHFPMKNITSRDLNATPMGGATSKPASDVVCLRRWSRIAMTFGAKI